jgi:hypothetical protein
LLPEAELAARLGQAARCCGILPSSYTPAL